MKFDPAYMVTTMNFFVQANRAAEIMRERDQEMVAAIEKLAAEYPLISITYDFG